MLINVAWNDLTFENSERSIERLGRSLGLSGSPLSLRKWQVNAFCRHQISGRRQISTSLQPSSFHSPTTLQLHSNSFRLKMKCATCKKPATLACSGCKGATVLEGDAPPVHYCNEGCQKANWTQHKATCRRLQDRIVLYSVVEMAQRLFYVNRELTWIYLDIEKVEKVGKHLILRGKACFQPRFPLPPSSPFHF